MAIQYEEAGTNFGLVVGERKFLVLAAIMAPTGHTSTLFQPRSVSSTYLSKHFIIKTIHKNEHDMIRLFPGMYTFTVREL